jgi:hypothetical protein
VHESLTGDRRARPWHSVSVHAGSRICSLKEACWILLGPAPFTLGGRTGKKRFHAVSPSTTHVLCSVPPDGVLRPLPIPPSPSRKGKRRVVARTHANNALECRFRRDRYSPIVNSWKDPSGAACPNS